MSYFGSPLAIPNPADLRFGVSPKPLPTRRGMVIGGGKVYPELNFTLPDIDIIEANMPAIERQYREMITSALTRATELEADGLVVEFETLPPMTQVPKWGILLTKILADAMEEAWVKHKLPSVLRATPNDTREFERPPIMRKGHYFDEMLETFEGCADVGAELLSIESVGGKELHDEALQNCDIAMVVFSLCVLGARDMKFLWGHLNKIASGRRGVYCAGDTACGFGNTAMVLAEQKMIPRTVAAVVRAISAARSLVAYECGAVGPGKDCGYENPILKAITGFPMAMEGKSAACAHFSSVGNVAAAACDTWSNESVANVKLLSGMAPTVSLEQLVYDCRLMNESLADGATASRQLRDWLVRSDAGRDPQAYVLTPESAVAIAGAIVGEKNHYRAGVAAGLKAVELIDTAHKAGKLKLSDRETPWLSRLRDELEALPVSEAEFVAQMTPMVEAGRCRLEDYPAM
jgi:methanol---5-hydroxybenzimidazolylcobamide Co-methyltransferase